MYLYIHIIYKLTFYGKERGAKKKHLETAKGFELLELLLNSQTATI